VVKSRVHFLAHAYGENSVGRGEFTLCAPQVGLKIGQAGLHRLRPGKPISLNRAGQDFFISLYLAKKVKLQTIKKAY
jgi:hypothetical protein